MLGKAKGTTFFSDNDTVEVKRRRQGAGGAGPTPGQRADAPSRRGRESGGGAPGGGAPGGGGSTGGGAPGGGLLGGGFSGGAGRGCLPLGRLPWWAVLLLIIGYVIYSLYFSGGAPDTTTPGALEPTQPSVGLPAATQPVYEPEPTSTAESAVSYPTASTSNSGAASTGQKWTVMLYEDADDQILEQDIYTDLNEVERVGSTDQVQIVAQVDRFKGAFSGDGNWTSTRRYFIRKDNDLSTLRSDMVQDLGEKNMADGNTLVDFITWAARTYPADKYMLVLSDHGMGWPGGWSDADPVTKDRSRVPIASALDDNMYLMELNRSLSDARKQAGIDKFELVGMDACLMGHLEVFTMLQQHARYAVASEETEPALGWAYTAFLKPLAQNPGMSGADLGKLIVQSYIKDDQRIVDENARADYLRQGSPLGGLFGGSNLSAGQLASQLSKGVTLTAVDLSALPALEKSVNTLAYAMQNEDQQAIATARTYAQSYTNIFGKEVQPPYIDLGSFVSILKREGSDAKTAQAADQVLAGIRGAVIAEKHGSDKPGSTGISIYFPNSTLYRSPVTGAQSYTGVADTFASVSLWDDFLAYHYNDVSFRSDATVPVVPGSSAPSRAPGQGTISVSPISASATSAAPGQPVTLSSRIEGKNIGYVYLFVGYYDQAANSINVIDTDYLESPETREINGVFYPKWKTDGLTMKLSWDPTVFQISDGQTSAVVLMTPERYGASPEEAIYTVDGTYTYAKDGASRRARLYFQNGALRHVYGFTGQDAAGAPREITPEPGDTFTVIEQWLDLNASGQVDQAATQDGQTLTFGDNMFSWQEVYAAQGKYVVGFIVEDMDGNRQQAFTPITVR